MLFKYNQNTMQKSFDREARTSFWYLGENFLVTLVALAIDLQEN